MRFFLFFLWIFFYHYGTAVAFFEQSSCDTLKEVSSLEEVLSPLATLFCEKRNSQGKCTYFDDDPGTFQDTTVAVSGSGLCSGAVIELTRGRETCKTPFLLTAGHCLDLKKRTSSHPFYLINHKIDLDIDISQFSTLQAQCVSSQDSPKNKNCLLTPNDILSDDNKINFNGVDQALIPLKSYNNNLPRIKVDLNSILNRSELTRCFQKEHKATVFSYLTTTHLDKIGKPEFKTDDDRDYIKAHTCNELSWLPTQTNYTIKQLIGHRCPSLKGMSGSFLKLSCDNKVALLVYQGQRLKGTSGDLEKKAKAGKHIYPHEYKGKTEFKNTATYIDPRLLELYARKYCGFSPLGT